MSVSARFIKLLKTIATEQMDTINEMIDQGKGSIDEKVRSWESQSQAKERPWASEPETSIYPKELIDDLSIFGLVPPSKIEEVKKARNREIRRFHPDKFLKDPTKEKTAKEIMQILNTAYARIEKYYNQKA